jgi:hypothetical protein
MQKIWALTLDAWDSPLEIYFTSKKKAQEFMKKYTPRYGWHLSSYRLNPKFLKGWDRTWFSNTREGKALLKKKVKKEGNN